MTDIDMLRDALAQRASRAPDTDVVLANTSDGIRRLRSRRKATALAGSVVVATGVLVAGVALLNRAGPPGGQDAQVPAAASSDPAPGTPGIQPRLPFTVTVPSGYTTYSWSVSAAESVVAFHSGTRQIEVALDDQAIPAMEGAQTTAITVRGVPAELRRFASDGSKPIGVVLTWQIAPGKWALIGATSEHEVRSVAGSMTTTPSDPPFAGRLARLPDGLSATVWGRGNGGPTVILVCPDNVTGRNIDKKQCAELSLNSGAAPDTVTTEVDGQNARLSTPDPAGVRHTPSGQILVRQVDALHWAQVKPGTSVGGAQLRDIILAVSAD